MTEDRKDGLRHHIVAGARDTMVVLAVLSVMGGFLSWITKPVWEPFSRIPMELQQVANGLEILSTEVNRRLRPNIIDFEGIGIVSKDSVEAGDAVSIVFTLRRNISCETNIVVRFWDHSLNGIAARYNYVIQSQKAPVTTESINFPVRVTIPNDMPPGVYSYSPLILPISCGVYEDQIAPMSEKFTVTNGSVD